MTRAHYVMIGGFLGAGKTTAMARFAAHLAAAGKRVGLITNDQSSGLVDTALLKAHGHAVEEIPGGCFCCRFNSLAEAAERLERDAHPDVYLAEPVGSCTDLVATVSYPLRRIYGARFQIAPLSVLVDPARAARVLGLAEGRAFTEKVLYVYEKQLEEADLIVVNKVDTLDVSERRALVGALEQRFPRAEVLCVSARTGEGCDAWFERILRAESLGAPDAPTMPIDYVTYAEGEALLGWHNLTARLVDPTGGALAAPFDANALLVELAGLVRARLHDAGVEIAHLKLTLDAGDASGRLAALSLVSTDGPLDLREALVDGVTGGQLIVNLRAEADPDLLSATVAQALAEATAALPGLAPVIEHAEHFRPSPPVPTHRDVVAAR
ncbi:MAG: GTP-binding protein [Planctomycetota bacterium]